MRKFKHSLPDDGYFGTPHQLVDASGSLPLLDRDLTLGSRSLLSLPGASVYLNVDKFPELYSGRFSDYVHKRRK